MKSKNIGKLLVVSGLPAAGKDTVISKFISKNPNYKMIVSHTNRPIRKGEIKGINHHFVTTEEFELLIKKDKLLEYVKTGLYYKGTTKNEFQNLLSGEDLIWRIELTRFIAFEHTISNHFDKNISSAIISNSKKILLKPENKKIAYQRYLSRDTQSNPKDFHIRWYAEQSLFKLHRESIQNIVVNKQGQLDHTVVEIEKIVY